jgi:uncharacterized protein YutE (UPF0331/DUF86 family)
VSPVIDRLAELRLQLDHLYDLRPRVTSPEALRNNLSLRNDLLYALQTVCQAVIDIASELSARRGLRFQTYNDAVQNLTSLPEFPPNVARGLEGLPGFRNILVHEYATLDYERVIEALGHLEPIEQFVEAVRRIEAAS